MVKKTKSYITWERNIIFLQIKEILTCTPRWHSYRDVVEETFNNFFTSSGCSFSGENQCYVCVLHYQMRIKGNISKDSVKVASAIFLLVWV